MTLALFASGPTAPGLFVTFDGPNGAGKTSLVEAVAGRLRNFGRTVVMTRQPSPTELGDTVRGAEASVRGRALACLVAGDRHHQLATEIRPALGAGAIVLCDRYVESSLVLQRLDEVDVEFILAVNAGIVRPDLRIRLLAHSAILAQRLAQRAADPARRFESTFNAPARELTLYEAADELLTRVHNAPSVIYDTTATDVNGLSALVAARILERLDVPR